MSTNFVFTENIQIATTNDAARPSLQLEPERLSPWSQSRAKRFFDVAFVLMILPLLIPALLFIAAAIRLTSHGPILFCQRRMGLHGREFTIVKFRTMAQCDDIAQIAITTTRNHTFTFLGPFLRWWKLDELPQFLNVLRADMSLVGPRPKVAGHQLSDLRCRPGITGAATLVFAREELSLAQVPADQLDDYYRDAILPLKRRLDAEYMARATFLSDLKVIVKTGTGRWGSCLPGNLPPIVVSDPNNGLVPTLLIRSQAAIDDSHRMKRDKANDQYISQQSCSDFLVDSRLGTRRPHLCKPGRCGNSRQRFGHEEKACK